MTAPRLLHVYPAFAIGGAQMRFVQLANHFGPRYRHLIVSLNGERQAFDRLSPDVDAVMLEVPVSRSRTWPNLGTYRRVLKQWRPDLLVTSNWGSIDWALANWDGLVPHLHMEDGFGPEETDRQLPRRVWTRRLCLRRSRVMLPSLTLRRLAGQVWRLDGKRLLHIPNGVDCDRFGGPADPAAAAAWNLAGKTPLIGTVATLRPEKNLGRLLEAFARLPRSPSSPPPWLAILGDGPERPGLNKLAAELGVADRVIFAGAYAQPEKLLPLFSLFALSSDTEQMPLSLLEAMASGLPVAATDVGDIRSMVAPENQRHVVPKDAAALAGAMRDLLENPARARALGAANRQRARAVYDQNLMVEAYRRLFDGMIAGWTPHPIQGKDTEQNE